MRVWIAVLMVGVGFGPSGCLLKKKRPDPPPRPAPPRLAPPAPAPVRLHPPPVRLYNDADGGIRDSVRLVVRDAAALASIWSKATSRQPDPPPAPAVDFAREMMLVVATGQVAADEEIHVDSVFVTEQMQADGKAAEILAVIVRVVEGCPGTSGVAYPVQIARVRRFDGPVRWDERRQPGRCRAD